MSLLQEIIIYIWLLPVVAQILLPLSLLLIWLLKKASLILIGKSTGLKSIAGDEIELNANAI